MAAKKRAAKKAAGQPAAKKQKKSDDPVWCVQSSRSPLVKQDLYALYSNPTTYETWTQEDWIEARKTLPDDAPYNADGYSVPITYFKYDINWRRYVREFQEDLAEGRLEPEWQKQANEAIEARARGDFDKWKAEEFEEFWGQKQKTNSRELAGESAQVKLEDLVRHGRIRVGDIISYARVFGKNKDRIMIEKDARVTKAEEGSLTIGIPPGQLKFARYLPTPVQAPQKTLSGGGDIIGSPLDNHEAPKLNGAKHPSPNKSQTSPQDTLLNSRKEDAHAANGDSREGPMQTPSLGLGSLSTESEDQKRSTVEDVENGDGGGLHSDQKLLPESPTIISQDGSTMQEPNQQYAVTSTQSKSHIEQISTDNPTPHVVVSEIENNVPSEALSSSSPSSQRLTEDVKLVTVNSLTELERHIVATDGRIPMQGYRSINSWKAMRAQRDNQDMGSLFDIREAWFISQSNTIVKEPAGRRRSGRETKSIQRG